MGLRGHYGEIRHHPQFAAARVEAHTVCFGDTTHFTDLSFSEGEVSEWLWHFGDPYSGDSDTSTLQHPVHWYTRAGIFNVTLEVADTNGCRTSIMQQVLVNPLPVAEFHFESATCQNQAIDFEDRSYSPGGAIHEWHWDFGDGTVITIYHPGNPDVSHTYTEQGNFTVGLTVVDTNGCSEYTEHYITVYPLPTANFTFSDTACEASLIYFQDSSIAQNTQLKSWFWDLNYPNQYYSPLQNPYFYYPETDMTYTVMLAIEDQHGCVDTIFKQVYVKKGFEIDFLADTVCFGTPTSFTDSVLSPTGDSLMNWSWNFGDGATSSEESPQHIFDDPGMHFVSLQANNQDGCPATATKEILVYALPEPAFSAAPAGCEDSTVFEDLSLYQSDSVNSWTWRFGDGTDTTILWPGSPDVFHFYPPQDSTYLATLIIENSRGCIDSIQQDVVRYPCLFVDFGEEGVLCDGQTATFRDYSFTGSEDVQMLDWEWFFGDGNSVYYTEQQDTLYHTYAAPGTYMVELVIRAEGNNGIVSDTSRHEVTVYNSPQSEFNFDKFCVKAPTEFTDYSFVDFGEIDRWYWNFGDGFTSRLQNPEHVYFQDSVYEVQLVTQTTDGCTDTVKHNLEIHALPEVYLVPDENRGCGDSLRFTFRDTSAQQHEVYRWTFDDDEFVNTDEDFISKLFYYGEHEVKLRVTSPWGCVNRDSASIELTRKPIAGFHLYSDSISILSPRVQISDESESMDALIEYWHYSLGNGYDTLARTFDYMYSDTGHYHIEQIVQDYNGCRDSISHKVFIYPELTFHIANAFTPNGDGVNATFKPRGRYFEDKAYSFQIFNRWGQSIFETFDYNEAWDGTFNGEPAPVGLYTWIITVTDTWGVTYTYDGYVVLIR
jgi:gliding motility-associated-like protein